MIHLYYKIKFTSFTKSLKSYNQSETYTELTQVVFKAITFVNLFIKCYLYNIRWDKLGQLKPSPHDKITTVSTHKNNTFQCLLLDKKYYSIPLELIHV